MKVILLEKVGRYGSLGDEVIVKNGFARNFLLPQGKALRATEANRKHFEAEKVAIEKRNEERKEQAAGIATGLNGHSIIMIRQAAETGQLYGSVSSRDISEALVRDGFEVQRSQVDLALAIKTVGLHEVELKLHAEVDINVKVNVARSEDEAKRQATGEDLLIVSYDDESDKVQDLGEVFEEDDKQLDELEPNSEDEAEDTGEVEAETAEEASQEAEVLEEEKQ
ncbi:MAG: 50S ribosomal protein L9 [Devosiaceae bacterium]|nr:50S ribosomal protein L9 [Devosiaceae bacterium]